MAGWRWDVATATNIACTHTSNFPPCIHLLFSVLWTVLLQQHKQYRYIAGHLMLRVRQLPSPRQHTSKSEFSHTSACKSIRAYNSHSVHCWLTLTSFAMLSETRDDTLSAICSANMETRINDLYLLLYSTWW